MASKVPAQQPGTSGDACAVCCGTYVNDIDDETTGEDSMAGSRVLIQTVHSGAMSTAWRRRWESLCVRFVIACSIDVPLCIIQNCNFEVEGSIVTSFLM